MPRMVDMWSCLLLLLTGTVLQATPHVDTVFPLDPRRVYVRFTTPVQGCRPTAYQVLPAQGFPSDISPCDQAVSNTYILRFALPFERGITYTLLIQGLQDASGAPVPALRITFRFSQPTRGDLVINEIHPAPTHARAEFVELYNRSADTLDLTHLYLQDSRHIPVPLPLEGRRLPPGAYLVLTRDSAAFHAAFPDGEAIPVPHWPALNNGGDEVSLLLEDVLIDRVSYEGSWLEGTSSIERRDPAAASHDAANWAPSSDPLRATPGAQNTRYRPDLQPPHLTEIIYHDTLHIELRFHEPIDSTQHLSPGILTMHPLPPSLPDLYIPSVDDHGLHLYFSTPLAYNTLYTLHFGDIRDYAGNTATGDTLFLTGPGSIPRPGDVIINEWLVHPSDLEFIELFNASDSPINLQHLSIRDSLSAPVPLSPEPRIILPGSYLVLAAEPDNLRLHFGMEIPVLNLSRWPTLNNGEDVLVLETTNTVLERVAYRLSGAESVSLERCNPRAPADYAGNWAPSTAPAGGTPGLPNTCLASDTVPPYPLAAEARTDREVYLRFNEAIDHRRLRPEQFRMGSIIPDSIHAAPYPAELVLFVRKLPTDALLFITNISDPAGNTTGSASIPVALPPVGIRINEILYEPEASQPEFVELYNPTSYAVTLRWTLLTGNRDTLAEADRKAILPAGGYAVMYATPQGDSLALQHAFPSVPETGVLLLPVNRSTLRLHNEGMSLALRYPGGVIDSLTYQPAWHHPDRLRTRGISLERLGGNSWTSSVAPEGATPGNPNSVRFPSTTETRHPGIALSPTPFAPDRDTALRITYHLEQPVARIQIRIFDINGREVSRPVPAALSGASGTVHWNGRTDSGRPLPTGIYIVFLEAIDRTTGYRRRFKKPLVLVR